MDSLGIWHTEQSVDMAYCTFKSYGILYGQLIKHTAWAGDIA